VIYFDQNYNSGQFAPNQYFESMNKPEQFSSNSIEHTNICGIPKAFRYTQMEKRTL